MLKILKNNQLNSKLRNLDWLLVFIVLLIGTISLLTIYSIDTGQNNYFEKHTIRFLFSFILLIAVALTSIKFRFLDLQITHTNLCILGPL